MKELEIPPAAKNDPESTEILRLWIADGAEWVSLNHRVYRDRDFKEEWAWGVFLSDTIKHLANAIHEASGKDKLEIIGEIRASFEAEMQNPTSAVRGGVLGESSDAGSE